MSSVPPGQLGASAIRALDTIVRKVAIDLMSSVIYRSPVGDATHWQHPAPPGYVGGRFRGNWQMGVGSAPSGELDSIDPQGTATLAVARASIPTTGAAGHVYYLVNNLPYAQRLDNNPGWSSQAPAGIVALAIAEFDGIVMRARVGQ